MEYGVQRTDQPGEYRITRDCPLCDDEASVVVPAQGLWDWEHGTPVQVAFPLLSPGDREIVRTGIHEACWEAMF